MSGRGHWWSVMSDSEGAADHVALVTGHVRLLGVCNTPTLTDSHHYNNAISLVHSFTHITTITSSAWYTLIHSHHYNNVISLVHTHSLTSLQLRHQPGVYNTHSGTHVSTITSRAWCLQHTLTDSRHYNNVISLVSSTHAH